MAIVYLALKLQTYTHKIWPLNKTKSKKNIGYCNISWVAKLFDAASSVFPH